MKKATKISAILCVLTAFCAMMCGCVNSMPPEKENNVPPAEWEEDGALKVLAIGNSFSVNCMEYLYQVAQSAGVQNVKLGNLVIGGCTLDVHAANAVADVAAYDYYSNADGNWKIAHGTRMQEGLAAENWDFILLQQASHYSGIPDSYGKLDDLIEYVKSHASEKAKLAWHMTWAYQQGCTHTAFPWYGSDQMTMYNAIVQSVQSKIVPNKAFSYIIPNGTAIQNARTSFWGDTLTQDGYHLNVKWGCYIASLTVFHTLTGKPVENLDFAPPGVSKKARAVSWESATNAVCTPFAVTPSKYAD